MSSIKLYDEDSLRCAVDSFIGSKSFEIYYKKLINEMRDNIEELTEEQFDLQSFKINVVDSVIEVEVSYYFIPSNDVFYEVVGERISNTLDIQRFKTICDYIVFNIGEKLETVIWGAVANYPVLRVVNGDYDSISLGDMEEFVVEVKSRSNIDFSDVNGLLW